MNHLPPKEGVIFRLTIQPECLDMRSHSCMTGDGVTFCIAGLILAASSIDMRYGPDGFAIGLELGEKPPSEYWINFEASLSATKVDRAHLVMPAKARETWAAWYGAQSAKLLPFYDADWGRRLDEVSAQNVIQILEVLARGNQLLN